MTRNLIVNADDFGLSESVSRGIIKAHRDGILTSTTFMVNFPWAAEVAPMLREAPDLGVGVHLNITTGEPLLPAAKVPSLVNAQGSFCRGLLHLRLRVSPDDVRREWAAQVEKAISLLDRPPTHLDTHRFLQAFPVFAQVMAEVARTYKIPAVRCLYPDMFPTGTFGALDPAGYLFRRYIPRSLSVLAGAGLKYPHRTLGGDFDLPGLLQRLEQAGEGVTEIISHPGELDDRARSLSSLQEQRQVELAAVIAPEARRKVEELGLRLVTFRALTDAGFAD